MTPPRFTRFYPKDEPLPPTGLWFAELNGSLLVQSSDAGTCLPNGPSPLPGERPADTVLLGMLDDTPCLACNLPADTPLPEGYRTLDLRGIYGAIDEDQFAVAGYAVQMLYWQRNSNFCMKCGNPLVAVPDEWGKRCTSCNHTTYPHVSPCVIVLVHDGDRVLLGHKPGWGPRYSVFAGFVEPGESLEECLVREVREETGVEVDELRYFGSQPWPFPHQLMVGFWARYVSGEIKADEAELDDVRWFQRDALPPLPPRLSIARKMLDAWGGAG
ncbi:MAG: NAD(+) diphosphatase [Chloroflexaceae bacterium]|nr:NAD(+) diphosphatase [Chloroflexaceae bacterium]